MTANDKKQLMAAACRVRMNVIKGVHAAKAGHPGGSLSAADMFTYLYKKELKVDPKNPKWEERDRFVLSKGHTAPGLYGVLAECGFFPEEDLLTLRQIGSHLQGHPNMNLTPGEICPPALWVRASPQLWAWHWPPSIRARPTVYTRCWVTARFRRARCGRP